MVSSSGGFETEVDCKVEDDETKDEDEVVVVLSDIAEADADANNFFFGITIFCFSFCDGVVAGGGILLSVEVEVLGIETGTEVELVEVEVEDTVSSGRDGAGVDNWIDDDELLDFVVELTSSVFDTSVFNLFEEEDEDGEVKEVDLFWEFLISNHIFQHSSAIYIYNKKIMINNNKKRDIKTIKI